MKLAGLRFFVFDLRFCMRESFLLSWLLALLSNLKTLAKRYRLRPLPAISYRAATGIDARIFKVDSNPPTSPKKSQTVYIDLD